MTRIKAARTMAAASAALGILAMAPESQAGPFTATVFARGSDISATAPDSITYGGGHVFIEYGNGASSTAPPGTAGSSTIAEYDTTGKLLNTTTLGGSVDGLRYNTNTNQLWALQNQDSNSSLTIIDPTTFAKSLYTYTNPVPPQGRGFDDVAFVGGNAYMSYTNPGGSSDPVLVQVTLGAGTLGFSSVLTLGATGTNTATGQSGQPIPLTDPDSLDLRPDGSLLVTGEGDGALTTVTNPGGALQSVSFVNLIDGSGARLTNPDDTVFAGAGSQQLLVADTKNNVIYSVQGGFTAGGAYSSIGSTNSLDSVNLTTGVATSISDGLFLSGASPHGLAFIPAAAVPEPSSLVLSTMALVAGLGYARRRRA